MSVVNNSFISERLSSLRNFLNEQLDIVQKELVDNYDTNMNEYATALVDKSEEITGLSSQVSDLTARNNKLTEENLNYQKVSLVKSLNNQLSEKDGEIKFLNSKIKQLTDMVDKLRQERDSLEKENANMNLTLGREILDLIESVVVPGLQKGAKIVVEQPLRELSEKYEVELDYVVNALVFVNMLTHLDNFGNCVYAMATSLKKVGLWFKSPVIKKLKTACAASASADDIVLELCSIISENDLLSDSAIESWAEQFNTNENLSKLNINEELFSVLLPGEEEVASEADQEASEADTEAAEEVEEVTEAVEEVTEAAEEVTATEEEVTATEEEVTATEEEVEEDQEASEAATEAEEEEVTEADQEAAEEVTEEEEELEFYELELFNPKTKKKVNYLITDDEQRDIYTLDSEEQPDEHVGRLVGKNNKAHFF